MARGLSTRSRFVVAYLLLGAAVGVALGALIVLLQRPAPKPPPPWSRWRPTTTTPARAARQIAAHVGSRYRLEDGGRLNRILVGGPTQGNTSVRAIGVQKVSRPKNLGDFDLYDEARSLMFVICGDGGSCKLQGEPTVARGTVVRREALELALYTLEYVKPVDNVVVFVPPGPDETKLSRALFFRRQDLSSALDHPLRRTLPHAQPPLPGMMDPVEERNVDELTGKRLFRYQGVANANNFGALVVLQPSD